MNMKLANSTRQQGVATLYTALIILIAITLVMLTISKTVLVETQMGADNYRTSQAVAAANYAMDYGFNYFNNGGFDQNTNATGAAVADGVVDVGADETFPPDGTIDQQFNALTLQSQDLRQTTRATLVFNNAAGTRCVPAGATPDMKNGMITATGFSDDGLATRTITQCVGPLEVLRSGGPKQPLVAHASVGLTGNARIINRYTDTTVWAGRPVLIGSSSTMETFINSPTSPATTEAERLDPDDSNHTQLVSNRNLGNGLDIIDNDPSLGALVGLEFFKNFFSVDTREQLENLADSKGQSFTDIGEALGKSGLIWVEGNQSWNGGTIGSLTSAAILVVNGDLSIQGGNAKLYGLLYVTGKLNITGSPELTGSCLVEGTDIATGTAATPPIISGHGTATLVYWPGFAGSGAKLLPGLGAVVSGSWRDW